MKKNVKLLISSALAALTFSMPQSIYGMDDPSKPIEQKKPSGIQLSKGSGNTLRKSLGMGDDIYLEMSIDLDILKAPLDKEQVEVTARLFLIDSQRCQTSHPAVDIPVKFYCESTPLKCSLTQDKPESFVSYAQFTDWLNQGYFKNEISITYDFHVDVKKSAFSLAQHVGLIPSGLTPDGYHFIGTHAIENSMIKPDRCEPQVT
jgi:hypothetical protein